MRFQFGMSVGHSYMYKPQSPFPEAHVPTVPARMDWCLDVQNPGEDSEEDVEEGISGYDGLGGGLEDMDDRELAVYHEMYDYAYR